jgi:hypothetical protein
MCSRQPLQAMTKSQSREVGPQNIKEIIANKKRIYRRDRIDNHVVFIRYYVDIYMCSR